MSEKININELADTYACMDAIIEISVQLGVTREHATSVLRDKRHYIALQFARNIEETNPTLAANLSKSFADKILLAEAMPKLFS
jgi:hypothetical protein